MHQVQFSDLKQLHFKVRRYLVEVNENGRKTEKEVIQGRKRGKCRKGYFENGINNIMTSYDYKTLLRLSNPLMSTQTQTPWLIAGWINESRQASNSDELAKTKTFKTGTSDQETTYSLR